MRKGVNIMISAIVMASMTSCIYKDIGLEYSPTVDVNVVFDWQNAPEAAPATMSLYMFSGSGEPVRYEFTDYKGGTIRIAAGSYDALCLNSDTENVTYQNTESKETFEVTTYGTTLLPSSLTSLGLRSDTAPRAAGTEEERVVYSPDLLWTDHLEGIELQVTKDNPTITLYPEVSVCTYTIEINNASNLAYIIGVSGALSTLSGGLLPGIGSDAVSEECVTLPFKVSISNDLSSVTGEFLTFGHCPSEQYTHILTIYAYLSDGTKWYYTYDVTSQVHNAEDQRNVHIVLDGLPIPKPIVNGGGLHPSVGDWQTVNVDIEM